MQEAFHRPGRYIHTLFRLAVAFGPAIDRTVHEVTSPQILLLSSHHFSVLYFKGEDCLNTCVSLVWTVLCIPYTYFFLYESNTLKVDSLAFTPADICFHSRIINPERFCLPFLGEKLVSRFKGSSATFCELEGTFRRNGSYMMANLPFAYKIWAAKKSRDMQTFPSNGSIFVTVLVCANEAFVCLTARILIVLIFMGLVVFNSVITLRGVPRCLELPD